MDIDVTFLTGWLTPERASWVLWLLRALMLFLLFFLLFRLCLCSSLSEIGGMRLPWVGVVVFFMAVYIYQASWQLTGFRSANLARFMRRYNKRPGGLQVLRGRIVDRNGVPLAANSTVAPDLRVYPLGPAAAHPVGYCDPVYGLMGIEGGADDFLAGRDIPSLKDAGRFGRNIIKRGEMRGGELRLTLDNRLQRISAELLFGRTGAVVIMDPRDGSILAMASAPSFNPSAMGPDLFARKGAPMLNRAVNGLYPPGSVFKILVAALAIDAGLDTPRDCPAEGFRATSRARPIRDHEYYSYKRKGREWKGFGRIGIEKALAHSSNVYFSQLGVALGGEALTKGAKGFGVGRRIAFFSGSSGRLSSSSGGMPELSDSEHKASAQVAIGQGRLLLTPLHVALTASAVASDGELWLPHLYSGSKPRLLGRACSVEAARRVRSLMRGAVASGTGIGADIKGMDVAGKTGTAQAPGGADHSWFVCMAPAENPSVVIAVLIERGGYGSVSALPVARTLLASCRDFGYIGENAE